MKIDIKFITKDVLKKDTEFVIQGNITDDENNLLVKGVPVCKELKTFDELKELYINDGTEKYRLRKFIDGTMIRVFYNELESKWYASTNRCLDAKMSKWSNTKSFGEYFFELLTNLYHKDENFESEEELLNKWFNKYFSYYFLIGSKDMNVVENIENDYIYLLNVLDKEFKEVNDYDFIYKFVPEVKFSEFENEEFVKNEKRGFVIENMNKRYVWFVDNYQSKRKSYGNEKYLGLRLLDVMIDKEKREAYLQKYPNHEKYITDIENSRNMFCRKAHILYKRRYIQKQFVTVTPELHYFVKNVYQDYLKNKKPIYYDDMVKYFDAYSKYSKFVFLKSHLSIIHPKLVGLPPYDKSKQKVVNNVNNVNTTKKEYTKSNEYESEFPPLNN